MPRINPEILVWARESAGLSQEEAVKRLGIKDARGVNPIQRLAALETGEREPSRPMLLKMSKQYRRSLLAFYLPRPPERANRGEDFRTLPRGHSESDDALLDALVRDIGARQSTVRAIIADDPDAKELNFIGSMHIRDGVSAVAASIRETLVFDRDAFRSAPTPEQAFTLLRERVEAIGIFVLLAGNLGSHHTSLDVESFRGFALADGIAPFIVINDQDSKAAWSFTLLHEVTHLWLGKTGVSGSTAGSRLERFCNDVAGRLLVSSSELDEFSRASDQDTRSLGQQIAAFASARNVSATLIAYRLLRAEILDDDAWTQLSDTFRRQWLQQRSDRRERSREQEGGPNYYVVRRHRVGKALIEFVRRNLAEGDLTTVKAGQVLGVRPKNVYPLLQPDAGRLRQAG